MRKLVLSLSIVAATAAAPLTAAGSNQGIFDHQRGDRAIQYGGSGARAGYSTVHALTGDWQSVNVYAVPNRQVLLPTGRPWIEYVARRAAGPRGGEGQVSWTSSRDCPALYNTLVWMTSLVAPRVEIAGVTPSDFEVAGRRPAIMMADGAEVTVWGRGAQPDNAVNTRIEMASNGGLLAEFGRAATENLSRCWRPEQPDLDAAE